ncbi:uroporphyrinogen-III synthase [Streptomyces sp. GBA 94-10 4N24]|uniref:uroporphyrinogen-III synthase n=1 Tax=Streptomyces sp. GBA 94-10 4N24 TaxID=1218177 RepID=UPI00056499F5|nr:uroporphyrinogen-III synthase [Streptomyces sp. GBA 94-10 4N24]
MSDVGVGESSPLVGFTVGVTAERRAQELGALLGRRGAEVVYAPALRVVPLADDRELREVTEELVARPPEIVVASTAVGFRGWVEAAEGWGVEAALREALGGARLLARGPKVTGAVRAAGLREEWSPRSEAMGEVLERLLAGGVAGLRVAVQLHGEPVPGFAEALRAAGAEVVGVPVYRWLPPADLTPVDRLVDATVRRTLDALTFTSAPAVVSVLRRAEALGLRDALVDAVNGDVAVVCVGPVTARPLQEAGVEPVQPERFRLGPMVQRLCEELPARAPELAVAGHRVQLRGHAVLVDGEARPVPPAPMALLRVLARRPGRVVARAELLRALPGAGRDEHAVESATARLRTALGAPELVQTVVKRGYRLALDDPGE